MQKAILTVVGPLSADHRSSSFATVRKYLKQTVVDSLNMGREEVTVHMLDDAGGETLTARLDYISDGATDLSKLEGAVDNIADTLVLRYEKATITCYAVPVAAEEAVVHQAKAGKVRRIPVREAHV